MTLCMWNLCCMAKTFSITLGRRKILDTGLCSEHYDHNIKRWFVDCKRNHSTTKQFWKMYLIFRDKMMMSETVIRKTPIASYNIQVKMYQLNKLSSCGYLILFVTIQCKLQLSLTVISYTYVCSFLRFDKLIAW